MDIFGTMKAASAALETHQVSARELCENVIVQITKIDGSVGAYSDTVFEIARAEASDSDRRRALEESLGALDGIPIAVKDLIATTPAKCGGGIPAFGDEQPDRDARVVEQLRSVGAVIMGVTTTDAGAFGTTTPQTYNPLDPTRIAGGSSGGSAAAVASGMAFAAIGTDTGGSIRIPAACCSVCGFKPSWGRVDMKGVKPMAPSFDHVGGIARSVDDIITLQRIIDPEIQGKMRQLPDRPTRLGIASSFFRDASEEIRDALQKMERRITALGVTCAPVVLPTHDAFMEIHVENALKEAFDLYSAIRPNDWQDFPEIARNSLAIGAGVTDEQYAKNEHRRVEIARQVERAFEHVDAVILPTLPVDAPLRGIERLTIGAEELHILNATIHYTALFNLTGHPVISIPGALTQDGRAINIQIVGAREKDAAVLKIAKWVQGVLDVQVDYANFVSRLALLRDKLIRRGNA